MRSQMAILTALVLAQPGWAQTDPGEDPELVRNPINQPGDAQRPAPAAPREAAQPTGAAEFSPARPHQPERVPEPGRLLPEGSFLVEQPGLLLVTPNGAWVFRPDPADDGSVVRPLVLLPSQILSRLDRLVSDAEPTARISLTGRVVLYRNQNYLLLTAIGEELPDAAEAQPIATQGAPEAMDGLSGEVESLIESLEAERVGVRSVISGLGSGEEGQLAPVAEGRTISRRRGRFVRLDAGELAFRFDNDDTDSPIEAPLVIAPCSRLEAVEETLEVYGDAMTATVSGQTLAFAGRSFLMPISIVIDRPSELDTRQ